MTPTPDFARLQVALAGGRPDRLPLAEVGIAPQVKEAFLGRPILNLQDEVCFWRDAGYDYVLLGRELALGLFPGIQYGWRSARHPGAGSTTRSWANEHAGVITSLAEFEAYPWPDPDAADYGEFRQIGALLPPGMGVIAYLGPIFQWIWMLMGFERFCYALRDDPALIAGMFQRVGQIRLAVAENVLSCCDAIGAIWMLDDIAYNDGPVVSPAVLRHYELPWLEAIAGLGRARRLPVLYHSDGAFWELLDDLLALGVGAIHPIEPNGMGRDLGRLKAHVRGKAALVGGIDLDILIRGSPADVAAETRRVLSTAAAGGGYLAGSSNAVTEHVPLENYRAMLDAVAEYAG